jgi:hypothetical protein
VKLTAIGPGLDGLKSRLQAIADLEVRVGVLGDGGYHGPELTNAELMAIHEFGAPRATVPDLRAHVRAGLEPPLQPATIRRKGSSTPLIDSGRLLQSFAYEVRSREG